MKGRILEMAGDTVLVEPLPEAESGSPPAACFGCARACGPAEGTGYAGLCPPGRAKGEPLRVKKNLEPGLAPGQVVELRREGLFFQAAAALLPPAAGFALGYTLVAHISPLMPGPLAGSRAGEGARAAAGVLFMFLCALCVYVFRRRHPARACFRIKNHELKIQA